MKRWKLILAMFVVFGCGMVLGVMLTIMVVQHRFEARMNSANWTPRTISWLANELELTTEQQNQIRPSVDDMTEALKQLQQNADTERKAIFGKMLMEITPILTADQQTELKDSLKKHVDQKQNSKQSTNGGRL